MKHYLVLLVVSVILLHSCGPSESAIQTAISQTQTGMPTNTAQPTLTPAPTLIPSPLSTPVFEEDEDEFVGVIFFHFDESYNFSFLRLNPPSYNVVGTSPSGYSQLIIYANHQGQISQVSLVMQFMQEDIEKGVKYFRTFSDFVPSSESQNPVEWFEDSYKTYAENVMNGNLEYKAEAVFGYIRLSLEFNPTFWRLDAFPVP